MDSKDNFEDLIKAKMDALAQTPPDKLGVQLKYKLNAQKDPDFRWSKVILWTIGSLLLIGFLIFQYIGNTSPKENIPSSNKFPQASQWDSEKHRNEENHGHQAPIINSSPKKDKILVAQTPDDIKNKPYIKARLQAKNEQKMIFMHAFNMDCNHCQKMRDSTLANPEIKAFLDKHFVKIDIDLQLMENKEVAQFYDIKTSPKFLFLNGKGQVVTIANGFQDAPKFIQTLENAMEDEAAGSYIDLMTKKWLNPVPNKLQKVNPLINVDLPDSFLLKVTTSQKLILINVYEADCKKCKKLEKVTFNDKNVQDLLSTRFARWTIDAEQAKSLGLFKSSNKYNAPITYIFSNQGTWISSFSGYMPPKPFLKTLKKSLTQNSFQFKGIQRLKAKVFPNPTRGKFNVAVEGKPAPLLIRIIDLQGKVILEQTQSTFNGEEKLNYDLTGQKGHYIIQFSQGKSMIYKKVIVQ